MKFPCSRLALRLAAVAALACLVACGPSTPPNVKSAQRGMTADKGGILEEKKFEEIEVEVPAYPAEAHWLEFQPRRNSDNRFFVDGETLSLDADRVVRYTVVVKSPSGALTIAYEGMRCKTAEYKVYAFGAKEGEWSRSPDPQWRGIPGSSANYRYTLFRDYFCDSEAVAGRNAKDLVARVRGNALNNVTDKYR